MGMTTLSGAAAVRGRAMVPAQSWDADDAVTQLYAAHYVGLVRLASLLVRHSGEAEEIVQDVFVSVHARWGRLREPDKALRYLRRSIVNAARSAQRHHVVADRHAHRESDEVRRVAPSAEQHALAAETRDEVLSALGRLPHRQREVLVLRYYTDLTEADIASTLGISRGAVKSHASRGLSALRSTFEDPS
jgi:RNA polymerase sigma-70 factor (sigma-E family)